MRFAPFLPKHTTAATFALLTAYAGVAPAQPIDSGLLPERGSEEAVKQARKLVEEGDAAMASGKYADGTAKYRSAFSMHPSYFTACKAGRGENELKRYPEAATYLAYCIKHFTLSPDEKQKAAEKKYRSLQADLLKKVGTLSILLSPKQASLTINGQALDEELFDAEAYVAPGEHRVEATASGFVSASRSVTLAAGSTEQLTLKLEAVASERPSAPPAPTTETPVTPEAPPAGDAPVDSNSMTVRNVVVGTGAVLTIGAIVGSFVFRAKASSKAEEAADLRSDLPPSACQGSPDPVCAELDMLQSERESAGTTADVFLGLGVGLGVASIATFFLWPKPQQRGQVSGAWMRPQAPLLDLTFGPRRAGVSFQGEF